MAGLTGFTFWVDENLPLALAAWLASREGCKGEHFRSLGFQESPDRDVFLRARGAGAIVVTKDEDFANLVTTLGGPPQVIWVRTGNVRTLALLDLFNSRFDSIMKHLTAGAPLIGLE